MCVYGPTTTDAATPDPCANRSGSLAKVIVPPEGGEDSTTTSLTDPVSICTEEAEEYPDPDASTTWVEPIVPPELSVVVLDALVPVVDRSPKVLSIQKPPTSRNMGPPKLNVASSTPRMSL